MLLVESDPEVEAWLRDTLSVCCPGALDITRAASHEAGRIALQVEPFDCALVAQRLSDADGLSLCALVRRTSVAPVALVLLLDEPDDRLALRALELGADDAVLRPDRGGPQVCATVHKAVARRRREAAL